MLCGGITFGRNFRDKTSPADLRRRHLIFALSKMSEPVPLAKLPEIDTRLALAYADKTAKTLSRDVNELIGRGLLVKSKNRVRARKEAIFGFLPVGTTWQRNLAVSHGNKYLSSNAFPDV